MKVSVFQRDMFSLVVSQSLSIPSDAQTSSREVWITVSVSKPIYVFPTPDRSSGLL
jgi:hypothetical protein